MTMAVFHSMRMVTVLSVLLASAALSPAIANEGKSSSNSEPKVRLESLSAAQTLAIALPGATGILFSAEPVHTAGWHQDAGSGEEGPALSELESRADSADEIICSALESAAALHDLPLLFFARLIWQESRFKIKAVSRAGAQGVAQFMPRVAAEMGLRDPFDPEQALPVSARLLSQLYDRFGNWGLAAAAYNGGPRRVREWLDRKGRLPKETRDYVLKITGISAERWAAAAPVNVEFRLPSRVPCDNLPSTQLHASAGTIPMPPGRPEAAEITEASAAAVMPPQRKQRAAEKAAAEGREGAKEWAVQLAAHPSRKNALAAFERLRKKLPEALAGLEPDVVSERKTKKSVRQRVQLAMHTRGKADELCSKIKANGGSCLVRRAGG